MATSSSGSSGTITGRWTCAAMRPSLPGPSDGSKIDEFSWIVMQRHQVGTARLRGLNQVRDLQAPGHMGDARGAFCAQRLAPINHARRMPVPVLGWRNDL